MSDYLGAKFPDVRASSVHRPAIIELYLQGVINGCQENRYCPTRNLTRAQAASLVARALEIPGESGQKFSDVPSSHAHAPAINALATRGIVNGFDDGTFRPQLEMTRAQFASLLQRALALPDGSGSRFEDVRRSNVHYGAIYALADRGITNGCTETRYCPGDFLRRDQAASLIHRMLAAR